MHNDERGHAMATGSAAAAAQLDGAIHNFLRWKAAVVPGLKGAVEADAGFALAHAVNGLVLHGARHAAFRPMIEGSIAAAKAAAGGPPGATRRAADLGRQAASKRLPACLREAGASLRRRQDATASRPTRFS